MVAIIGPDGTFVEATPEQAAKLDAMKDAAAEPVAPKGPSMFKAPDGKMYTVPETSYDAAIKNGWKLADDKEASREHMIQANVDKTSQLSGALDTFANEATMGIKNYIGNKEAGPEQGAIDEEIRNRIAKRDPITHVLSAAAGFVAPLAIPGVGEAGLAAKGAVLGERATEEGVVKAIAEHTVAQAAEATLTRKIAATATQYATEGAIYSAPKAAVQVAYGDPEQAAETMLAGIGISAVAGGAVAGIGAAAKGAASKVAESSEGLVSKLSDVQPNGLTHADNFARQFLGITDKQAKKMGSRKLAEVVNAADEAGILQSGNVMKSSEALLESSGKNIGDHLKKLEAHLSDPEIKKLVTSPIEVSNQIQAAAMEKFPEIIMETHSAQLKELSKIVKDVGAGGAEPSFDVLQAIRTGLGKGKKAFEKGTPNAELYQMADGVIQKNIEESAQKVYMAGAEPASFPDYLKQKQHYYSAKQILNNKNEFKGGLRLPTSLESIVGGGSSAVNIGLGAVYGHPIGAGVVGAGKYVVNKLLKNEAFMGNAVSVIRKISKDPASLPILGGLLAKEGQAAFTAHLDSIPTLLTTVPSKAVALGANHAVASFLGDEAKGLSKDQQFKRVSDKLSSMMTNNSVTADQVGHISSVFTGSSVQLASLVAQKKLGAIAYLHSQLPKDPNGPQPFQKNDWKPSKQDQLIFDRKLGIVMNPMAIWSHIQDHTVTQADVDTLKAVYPKIYNAMVEKTVQAAYDPRLGAVGHQRRMAVSAFTGMPLDDSIKNIANIQAAIQGSAHKTASISKPAKASAHPKMDRAPTLMTDVQRRTAGRKP